MKMKIDVTEMLSDLAFAGVQNYEHEMMELIYAEVQHHVANGHNPVTVEFEFGFSHAARLRKEKEEAQA